MNTTITVLTRKKLALKARKMILPYRYFSDGYSWETKEELGNYLFFMGLQIRQVKSLANGNKLVVTSENNTSIAAGGLRLVNFEEYNALTDYNEILTLQNGDYVIQRVLPNGKCISLFSGYHAEDNLLADYKKANAILKKVNFRKVSKNTALKGNEIVVFDFIGLKEITLRKRVLTIHTYGQETTIEDKKETIRQYDNSLQNAIIMANNGIFYIIPN